jgi:hypothetical protein
MAGLNIGMFDIGIFNSLRNCMAKKTVWADKVCALVQGGNPSAALAQMRVAPTAKDLVQLRTLLDRAGLLAKHPTLALALEDHLALLSSPRLHRAP